MCVRDYVEPETYSTNYLCVCVSEEMPKDVEFEVVGDAPEKAPATSAPEQEKSITNGNKDSAQPSTSTKGKVTALNPLW